MRELLVPMSLGSRRKPSEIVTRSSRLLPSGIPFGKGLEQLRLSVEQLSDVLILGLMGGWLGWGCQLLDYLGHVGVLEVFWTASGLTGASLVSLSANSFFGIGYLSY